MYELIIVGGGAAGITAGIYAARQGLKSLLIAKDFKGQIAKKTVAIENYPGFEQISGFELVKKFENHLRSQKIDIEQDTVENLAKKPNGFFISTANKKEFQAKAVIVATGSKPKHLNIKGEKEFIGRGVSYCAVCDGPLFANKVVAVIGGGNSGFEAAIFLSRAAKKVYIMQYAEKPTADDNNQKRAKEINNIELITAAELKEIKGDRLVEGIIYQDLNSKELRALKVGGVFVEIGYLPAVGFLEKLVELNEKNEIKIEPYDCSTTIPGLFSAGDVTNVAVKQIVVAAGEGAKAALSAYSYLQRSL